MGDILRVVTTLINSTYAEICLTRTKNDGNI